MEAADRAAALADLAALRQVRAGGIRLPQAYRRSHCCCATPVPHQSAALLPQAPPASLYAVHVSVPPFWLRRFSPPPFVWFISAPVSATPLRTIIPPRSHTFCWNNAALTVHAERERERERERKRASERVRAEREREREREIEIQRERER